ncbi:MAG: GH25 family lysozyme [Kofleriaceae bacterium]
MKRVLCLLLSAACADQSNDVVSTLEQGATVCGTGPTVKGIDVSKYQGNIDWAAAKADGVDYAFVRVSDGVNTIDEKFDRNWAGTRANGILRGAYQFFRPSQDVIAQADLLLARMGTLEADDLPPVIDVEANDGLAAGTVAAKVRQWLEYVTPKLGGRVPIIYTGFYFWRDQVGAPDLTTSPLWHAQYSSIECPNIAPPWQDWAFWQFTSSGSIAGIAGNVDVNRFNGTRDQLLALTSGEVRACGTIERDGGVIDDGDACFSAGGPQSSLRHVASAGEGDDLIWTHTTEGATEANFAQWNLAFAEPGRYKLEVATSAAFAQSKQARYVVHVSGADHEVVIDQTAVDGYQSLGEFDVAAGADQFVHLGDNTGELLANNIQLVFDSVRVTRIGDPGDPGEPGTEDPGKDGGCSTTGGASGIALALLGIVVGLRRRCR